MQKELLRYRKYVAGTTPKAALEARRHFRSLGMKVKTFPNVTALEWAKVFETSYRAVMIGAFQEFHRVCHANNISLADAAQLIADDHRILKDRPLYYPGFIGGHCLMPNVNLLLEAYRSYLFRWVKQSNICRCEEIADPAIRAEVEQMRVRVEGQ